MHPAVTGRDDPDDRLLQVVAIELREQARRIEAVATAIVAHSAAARACAGMLQSIDAAAQAVTGCAGLIDAVARHEDAAQAVADLRLAEVRDRLRHRLDGMQRS